MLETKTKQIAIVWANPYNKNLGVGALAYSTLAIFHDIVKDNNFTAEITFVGSSSFEKDELVVNGENIPFGNIIGLDYFKLKSWVKMALFPRRHKLAKLLQFDYIYDIAEGDSFTDIYGPGRFWSILNSKRLFAFLNKKQLLLPQTIGPFNDVSNEKAAFAAMNKLNRVISRDKQSFDYTAKHLPKDKIVETIDVAFYMPFERKVFGENEIHVGLNVSGLLWNGGYTKNNQFSMKTDYKKLIRATIDFLSKQDKVRIHLVPHVIPLDYAVEDDYSVSEELMREFPELIIAPRFSSPIEAKGYISGLNFFTGARMHACIAAFSTGVPVFPMAYSRKFNGLFGETLKYKWMGDCVNETEENILENLKMAFADRAALKNQIEISNRDIVKPRLQLLKSILTESLKD